MGETKPVPDQTATTTALWRASHLSLDAQPHVLEDDVGLKLVSPESDWLTRPPVAGRYASYWRASCLARARFAEDLALSLAETGPVQYVILGAGLDSFSVRKPHTPHTLRVFEIDEPRTQVWKQRRLKDEGFDPRDAAFVGVNFEAGESWVDRLTASGFDRSAPALVASSGVTQYISRDATLSNFRLAASLAVGSLYACSYMRAPGSLSDDFERDQVSRTAARAAAAGHPWTSYYESEEFVAMASSSGFGKAEVFSADRLTERYFGARPDGLRPSSAEGMVLGSL